jgi:hypothetical protein
VPRHLDVLMQQSMLKAVKHCKHDVCLADIAVFPWMPGELRLWKKNGVMAIRVIEHLAVGRAEPEFSNPLL